MEQSALLNHDIDTFKNELAAIGIQDYLTRVAHVCACALLCPAVWSLLPKELLQCIFARLPLPDIIRLRVLSKTWDKYVTGVIPGFTKLCAEQNPIMFALVSQWSKFERDNGPMVIKLYDNKEKRWHQFVHATSVLKSCDTMFAGDGGLVSLVCTAQDKERFPLKIVVFNPLTRQWRELPSSSSLSRIQPCMVQLVIDQDSTCYKVLVMGPKQKGGGDAVVRIFSSATGKWSEPNIFSDLIFGCHYEWYNIPRYGVLVGENVGRCAYDCASSTLFEPNDGIYLNKFKALRVFVKDRLFCLHFISKYECLLTEYQFQSCEPHWVEVKVYKYYELDEVSNYERGRRLYGCQDFLVVNAYRECAGEPLQRQTVLFDLSTRQWQIISEIPEWTPYAYAWNMFELRWDAVP